jgi:ABC-2 type transport system ATP-binding protein
MPQIIVENLTKTFKVARRSAGIGPLLKSLIKRDTVIVKALQGVSFSLEAGELTGYIGPNGAGKSTTVKIMSGILVPDSGLCRVMDYVPWLQRSQYVRHIGVVFGQRSQLWWDVPVIDSFNLLKDIYRVPDHSYRSSLNTLVDILDLKTLLNIPVRQLSLGQKMRCELAAALLHRPRILFLDEPTIGLDAVSKLAVRDFIRCINREQGVTVILTTHDMDDIEALCSRLIIIGKGRLFFDGSPADLRASKAPHRKLKIDFLRPPSRLDIPEVERVLLTDSRAEITFDPGRINVQELVRRISGYHEIRDFVVENPPIEEIIARAYGDLQL